MVNNKIQVKWQALNNCLQNTRYKHNGFRQFEKKIDSWNPLIAESV